MGEKWGRKERKTERKDWKTMKEKEWKQVLGSVKSSEVTVT